MLKTKLIDGQGTSNALKINKGGVTETIVHPHPPLEEPVFVLPFREYFMDSSGAIDMRVNGSTASPLDFTIDASDTYDTFIKTISIEIADASATLNKFGNITALTNGVEFCWETQDRGTVVIHEALQSNWDFIRLCAGNPSFGDAANAFKANNVSGTSEGYIPVMNIAEVFGMPWGLKLRKGTNDKLFFRIKDDVRAIDAFDVIGYGIQL